MGVVAVVVLLLFLVLFLSLLLLCFIGVFLLAKPLFWATLGECGMFSAPLATRWVVFDFFVEEALVRMDKDISIQFKVCFLWEAPCPEVRPHHNKNKEILTAQIFNDTRHFVAGQNLSFRFQGSGDFR